MLHSATGFDGAFSAPHRAAALAGRDILQAGGTAIEAMIAAAATIAVTYPHMNGIGGDGFWLIHRPGQKVTGISACGQAARLATPEWYRERGFATTMPTRGPLAALTVPGTVGGWEKALSLVPEEQRLPLDTLLSSAIDYAENGIAVTGNQSQCTADKLVGLRDVPGFAETFLIDGAVPEAGARLCQKPLAATLRTLAELGLFSYYTGDLARTHAAFLEDSGSPLRFEDFAACEARIVAPLHVETSHGTLMNMTPPTQGVASLMILAVFDRLGVAKGEGFDHLHGLIEATKQAFLVRNAGLGDPDFMTEPVQDWLADDRLDALAARIDMKQALPWPHEPAEGDTIWMGAADRYGNVVSFIQSVYWASVHYRDIDSR
ncbi:MAG: gamma-glutamyltransferase [Martelella sp.]|uniref:gamma-glutamyltransferase family protein n=1 Tax=Martelella sp. TaxID=1969699 RepID=UPI0032427F99